MKKDNEITEKVESNTEETVVEKDKKEIEEKKPQEIVYDDVLFTELDAAREDFHKFYNITNIFKWIFLVIVFGIILFGALYLSKLENGLTWMLISSGTALALLAIYTVLMNQFKKKRIEKYFVVYYQNICKFVFDNKYNDVINNPKTGIEAIEFIDSNIYKDIVSVPSRNITTYSFNNTNMKICDCAGQVKTKKKIAPVFVGKMLISPNTYNDDNGIIIYYTCSKELALPPTKLDGINKVYDDKKIQIFTNNEKYTKTITRSVKIALNKISMDDVLIDMTISIQKGKTYIAMGYDDSLMIVPFESKFQPGPTKDYKKQLLLASEIAALLNDKGGFADEEK